MDGRAKKALSYGRRSLWRIVSIPLKVLGTVFLILITTAALLALVGTVYINQNLKVDLDLDLNSFTLKQTSTVYCYDADGNEIELATLHGQENRALAEFNEIPKSMINALIAVEDKRFFSHQGVDWKRTAAAFGGMFVSTDKITGGGSTITQQLIKNLTDEKEVTVRRKVSEIFRALEFEKHYTKEEILEWYLNTCFFGQDCYGVKVAARTYFDKDLSEITVAEAASIICITNSPTRYNPFRNPEKNKERQETVLALMFEQGMLTEWEYRQAVAQKLVFVHENKTSEQDVQSYFVDQVYRDVSADLAVKYGVTEAFAQQMLLNGGYKIYTTMRPDIQSIMDEIFQNEENIPAVKGLDKPQAAMILMDPYTGAVLGMEGGVGQKVGNLVLNRAVKSTRQPGSSIKPVAVYAPALDYNLITPYSVLDDAPFRLVDDRAWPRNSNGRYKGRTTILAGVTSSTNTMAVRTLDLLKPQLSYQFATEKMHLSTLTEQDIDYAPLALGGLTKGVSVLELTAAYCAFPNQGEYITPRTYTLVTNNDGAEIILDNQPQREIAMQEKTAWYMNTLLQSVVQSGTGSRAQLAVNMPAAGKTGTTTRDYDRLFVGYTPYYCAGVWFGYDEQKKIELEQSTNPALALWKMVMDKVHAELEREEFFKLENVVQASYCLDSGMVPSENCKLDPRGDRVATGYFYKDDVPRAPCTVHSLTQWDAVTGHLATPYCPSENLRWVSLLSVSRAMPAAGVTIEDEGYRVRTFGGEEYPEGFFPPADPADGAPNSYCPLHASPDWALPPEIDPNDPGGDPNVTPPESPPPDLSPPQDVSLPPPPLDTSP
ncbi:MAG: transglycosylase domain-containing protein [Oscillospiraceae bacterium]|nr:transglycosylase domain-containing protein [Oscillospiraceae bacterium]